MIDAARSGRQPEISPKSPDKPEEPSIESPKEPCPSEKVDADTEAQTSSHDSKEEPKNGRHEDERFVHYRCHTLAHFIALLCRPAASRLPSNRAVVVIDSLSALLNEAFPKTQDVRRDIKAKKGTQIFSLPTRAICLPHRRSRLIYPLRIRPINPPAPDSPIRHRRPTETCRNAQLRRRAPLAVCDAHAAARPRRGAHPSYQRERMGAGGRSPAGAVPGLDMERGEGRGFALCRGAEGCGEEGGEPREGVCFSSRRGAYYFAVERVGGGIELEC